LSLEVLEDRFAPAIVYQVSTMNDTHLDTTSNDFFSNTAPYYGWDATGSHSISLRSAIEAISSLPAGFTSAATIELPAGTYDLSQGELDLHPQPGVAVSIIGQGGSPSATVIDAQGLSRVLEVEQSVGSLTLQNLTLQHGQATDGGAAASAYVLGGGILDESAPLNLQSVTVTANSATTSAVGVDALGGGLFAGSAAVSITNSTISSNTVSSYNARGYGAGVAINSGTLTITDSNLVQNGIFYGTTVAGGGLYASTTPVNISGSNISSNIAYANPNAPTNALGSNAEGGGIAFTTLGGTQSLTICYSQSDFNNG